MKIINYFKNKFKCGKKSTAEFQTSKRSEKHEIPENVPIFSTEILDDFRENVGKFPAETGGMIGCSKAFGHVDLWVFDKTSRNTAGSFAYNEKEMTKYYHKWKGTGGTVTGFVHSHPAGYRQPSNADIKMSLVLMDFFKNDFFYLPILQSDRKGHYELLFYIVRRTEGELTLELSYTVNATSSGYEYLAGENEILHLPIDDYRTKSEKRHVKNHVISNNIRSGEDYFSRLKNFYPEAVLDKVLIYGGCGGVRSEIINMARNGFRNFILIDGDEVSPPNIATQGVYRNEVGMNKVDAIANEIHAINPNARVICVSKMIDNNMSDEEFCSYLNLFPGKTSTDYLIHGMTDCHHAQMRIAKIAMNLGIPYIGAAMYKYGLGGEVIFTYPGVTRSCPRCMLRSRYEAYENGFQNDVTSEGCPTFATERLNTTIGFISLMLLMYKSAPGNPYNNMLDAVANRNFVQIRMSPLLEESLNVSTFNIAFDSHDSQFLYFDETIWVPQHPDSPEFGEETCKLCGGSGDLKTLINKWQDTRKE